MTDPNPIHIPRMILAILLGFCAGPLIAGFLGLLLGLPSDPLSSAFAFAWLVTMFGGPVYVLIGIPILVINARRTFVDAPSGVIGGLLANFLGFLLAGAVFAVAEPEGLGLVIITFAVGLLAGPIWGAVTGAIYSYLNPDQKRS